MSMVPGVARLIAQTGGSSHSQGVSHTSGHTSSSQPHVPSEESDTSGQMQGMDSQRVVTRSSEHENMVIPQVETGVGGRDTQSFRLENESEQLSRVAEGVGNTGQNSRSHETEFHIGEDSSEAHDGNCEVGSVGRDMEIGDVVLGDTANNEGVNDVAPVIN
ncbi:hypothetical protein V6N13_123478 [Hibiscus sabdariffa]|uniref:Uncharacterized protein n=1 Tax=Hibiscus sabdariffa TaxID=183260 RepID=A0ABR2QTL2_9ROSI